MLVFFKLLLHQSYHVFEQLAGVRFECDEPEVECVDLFFPALG